MGGGGGGGRKGHNGPSNLSYSIVKLYGIEKGLVKLPVRKVRLANQHRNSRCMRSP